MLNLENQLSKINTQCNHCADRAAYPCVVVFQRQGGYVKVVVDEGPQHVAGGGVLPCTQASELSACFCKR